MKLVYQEVLTDPVKMIPFEQFFSLDFQVYAQESQQGTGN
jgi:hypothetical protein